MAQGEEDEAASRDEQAAINDPANEMASVTTTRFSRRVPGLKKRGTFNVIRDLCRNRESGLKTHDGGLQRVKRLPKISYTQMCALSRPAWCRRGVIRCMQNVP